MTTDDEVQKAVDAANALMKGAYQGLESAGVIRSPKPVGRVQWIHIDEVQANDYNPNSVAHQEMRLLHTSISEDGYTQPVVAIFDDEIGKYVIVDGFHRYSTMRMYEDIRESTSGYLPVVVIEKDIADRIASTVRHNRARGKHSVTGMSSLVFQMLEEGEDDATICNKLGLEPEELARLKYVTGYAKLYEDVKDYSPYKMNSSQAKLRAQWAKDHPNEPMPEGV